MSHHIAPNRKNLIGKRFNRLLVLKAVGKTVNRSITYLCACDCGEQKVISTDALNKGQKSCGCINKEKPSGKESPTYIHGETDTRAYKSWAMMIQRCTNPNNHKFKRYGGRGIQVCKRWLEFALFFEDMGHCPFGHSIERRDNNGNYDPSNCLWIPRAAQARNRSNNRVITYQGQSRVVAEWASVLGIPHVTLRMRLHRGWPVERAFTR